MNVIKYLLIMTSILFLTNCAIPSTNDSGWYPPILHRYQKPDQIGSTNLEQRRDDAMACGAINRNDRVDGIFGGRPRETYEIVNKRGEQWRRCMINKGYIIIKECGKNKETSICR